VEQPTVSSPMSQEPLGFAADPSAPARARLLRWMCGVVGCAALAGGCAQPTQRPVIAVPAAFSQGVGRHLYSPFELSDKPADAVVRLVTEVTCTGTLIAEDLVLTAHHCVSRRDAKGRVLEQDIDPSEISVELGGDDLPWGEVTVREIVAPNCGYAAGDGDIAILVLSRKLIGVTTMVPRVQAEPQIAKAEQKAEEIFPIGFGRCALTQGGIHRVWRADKAGQGAVVRSLSSGQFTAPASICPGDSGAPAYSIASGEIVGVVSASVMDGDEHTVGMTFFTRLDAWKGLFSAAREIADGASSSELPPFRTCRH